MASDLTTLQALRNEAVTAIGISDWATAKTKLIQCQTIITTTPDAEINSARTEWQATAQGIEGLLNRVDKELSKPSGGNVIQQTRIKYAPVNP